MKFSLTITMILCVVTCMASVTKDTIDNRNNTRRVHQLGILGGASLDFPDYAQLNDLLAPKNYPELTGSLPGWKIGLCSVSPRGTYASFEYARFVLAETGDVDYQRSNLSGWDVAMGMHLNLTGNPSFLFYPLVGVGIRKLSLSIRNMDYPYYSFEDLLEYPVGEKVLKSSENLYVKVGAGMERELNFLQDGMFIAVKGGYRFPLNEMTWSAGTVQVMDFPGFKNEGFWAEFVLRFVISRNESERK